MRQIVCEEQSDECAICRKILSKGIPKGETRRAGVSQSKRCPLCSVSRDSTRWDAVPDGAVTASVESWEWPAKDGESNFGAGYDYLLGEPGKLYVNFDGNWIVFEKWEEAESRAGG